MILHWTILTIFIEKYWLCTSFTGQLVHPNVTRFFTPQVQCYWLQQRIWNASRKDETWDDVVNGTDQTIGFSVKNAVLFPTEVEKGMWPEDYSLSDHARLTVVFSPLKMPCSRLSSWVVCDCTELKMTSKSKRSSQSNFW